MKIFYISISLLCVLLNTSFADTYQAQGFGATPKEAREDALKNLSLRFLANVDTSEQRVKEQNKDNFTSLASSSLKIKSNLSIPNVQFSKAIKTNNTIQTTASVDEKDILKFAQSIKTKYDRDLSTLSEDKLFNAMDAIENIETLIHMLSFENKEHMIMFLNNKIQDIDRLLEYGVLHINTDIKNTKIYLDNTKISTNKILVEPNKIHMLRASKKGYFDIEQKISFRQRDTKYINLDFIKNKTRKIHIKIDAKYKTKLTNFLEKFRIQNTSSSNRIFQIYFDKISSKEVFKRVKVTVSAFLKNKENKKTIKTYNIEKTKICTSLDCVDDIKMNLIKKLIKQSLFEIDTKGR